MHQVEIGDHPPDVSRQPRRRRWRLWVGLVVFVFVLWLAVMYGFFAYWTDHDLREAMAVADRDSPRGWQLDDIEAHREQVPDEENAALVILKVKSLLPANWPTPIVPLAPAEKEDGNGDDAADKPLNWDEKLRDLSPEVQLNAAVLHGLRASLAEIEPARAEARKLIGMTRGRFPLVWDATLYATTLHSQNARSTVNLLRYEAALASQEGDADGAVAFVRGLIGSARSVGDEPLLISVLIRLAGDAQAVLSLERALAQGEPSVWELEAVQALLEKEATEPLFVQAMRGERAAMHKMLLSWRHGEGGLAQLAGATGGVDKMVLDLTGPTLARRSHPQMLRLLNEYVEASQLPLEKQPAAMKNLERQVIQAKLQYDVVTALMMPATIKVSNAYRRGVGNLRCAFVAVALERFRRDHGSWPETLDALVPQYLAAVPADPQDGKPLRLKRRPDGVVVYWIGHDDTDDGGKLDRRNSLAKGTDQGFQLWDVKQRRQPPREVLPMPKEEEAP
jgi:hypothetical protein